MQSWELRTWEESRKIEWYFQPFLIFFIFLTLSALLNIKLKSDSVEKIFSHLKRDKIESNLSVPGIQGGLDNAFYKSFKNKPQLDKSAG